MVVGVEAKVEESLDEPMYKIIEDLNIKKTEDAKGKYERLKYLYKCIYDSKIDNKYKHSEGFYRLPGFEDIKFYVEDLYI
ncbi:MAG: hypothetical protein ACLTA8_10725 [Intestinibacter bartlettii]|uniref:hypothetical protein n=1 Tax=Intestinibacter bartlettii TaxID=261299 RepID=UPI002903ABCA|nr:hypothetical protein [Intestinibacter bartlettii]MDU2162645.1 hypothetical protein [Intestinibacter bartlettii]